MSRNVGCTRRVAAQEYSIWICGCRDRQAEGDLTLYVNQPHDHVCETGLVVKDRIVDSWLADDYQEGQA